MTPLDDTRLRTRRIIAAIVLGVGVVVVVVLALLHGREVLAFFTDGQRVQQQAARLGPVAPLALGTLVVLQEVTVVVPSEPLELAAGYAFGFWRGAAVYLCASVVGCLAIMGVVRVFGGKVLALLLSAKQRSRLSRLEVNRRFDLVILVCFFVPGLPKDVLIYVGALAGMRPVHLVVVTTLGRLPSTATALFASSLAAEGDWRASALVFGVLVALVLCGVMVYHVVSKRLSA